MNLLINLINFIYILYYTDINITVMLSISFPTLQAIHKKNTLYQNESESESWGLGSRENQQ